MQRWTRRQSYAVLSLPANQHLQRHCCSLAFPVLYSPETSGAACRVTLLLIFYPLCQSANQHGDKMQEDCFCAADYSSVS